VADVEHTVDTPETETVASIDWPPSPAVSTVMEDVPSPSVIVPAVMCHLNSGLAGNYGVELGAENDRHSLVNFFRGNFNGDHLTPVRSLR
jgi:hypothetical protein